MRLVCLQCDHEFEGTLDLDALGWHSSCPACGGSFDVDVDEDLEARLEEQPSGSYDLPE